MLASKLSGQPVPRETATWLAGIGGKLKQRLAKAGLVEAGPTCPSLGHWCHRYIASRTDAAPRTLIRLRTAAKRMIAYFGADKPLDQITPFEASQFANWDGLGQAANTKRRLAGTAKQFLGAAVRARLLVHNPFVGIPTSTRPERSRDVFIDRNTLGQLLDACASAEERAVLLLCRIGGLRCPSEVLVLEWGHILWDRDRFVVPCV